MQYIYSQGGGWCSLYLTTQYIYSQGGGWCSLYWFDPYFKMVPKTPNLSWYQVIPGRPKFTGFLIQGRGFFREKFRGGGGGGGETNVSRNRGGA